MGLICYFMFGCHAAVPLYVIDLQKLAGATPETADQFLKEMVPCNLMHEDRWEEGQGDVEDIIGKLNSRVYDIENGQIDRWERKPRVRLNFDPYYEERVNGLYLHFIEYVDTIDVLRQLGYDPNKRIKHINQHGTGASASLKKCTYSHAEFFDDVGEIIEIVEKDFTLKPTMESYPL